MNKRQLLIGAWIVSASLLLPGICAGAGFRSIELGMDKGEVREVIRRDSSFGGNLNLLQTKIGDYTTRVFLKFDNNGKLYSIILKTPKVTAKKIKLLVQPQLVFFYSIFKEKFGEPAYRRKADDKINIFDFEEGYYKHMYRWDEESISRYISLDERESEFGLTIIIKDRELADKKEEQDKVDAEKKKSEIIEDF